MPGFSEKTLEYFLHIRLDNSKSRFEALRPMYEQHVREPLLDLYEALAPQMLLIDGDISTRRARCVSGAYNDARYARSEPIKPYFYLRFRAQPGRDTDIPGFFMDASCDFWRYGLQVYRPTTAGAARLRDAGLESPRTLSRITSAIEARGEFQPLGESYKKDRVPSAPAALKDWLNRKSWFVGRVSPSDGDLFSPELPDRLLDGFLSLQDLYRYIGDALNI